MKIYSKFISITSLVFCLSSLASGQSINLITGRSAGKVRLGMTIAQVRKAVSPMKLARTSDGEGIALIAVRRGKNNVMTIYAGEEDRDTKISEKAKVEQIWVWDKTYKTANGVHPGMLLADAEKKYGKVTSIKMSEIESREFAKFRNGPAGIDFRLSGKGDSAGIYPNGSRTTTKYSPGTYIFSIDVTGRLVSDDKVAFTRTGTDLMKGCRSAGGNEGGHVSHFCKGPGKYQIHYFDAATVYQIDVATDDRSWEVPLELIGLDKLSAVRTVDWLLADGKPFAVVVRKPDSDDVVVRGLKGFERIKLEESGKGAIERASSEANSEYENIIAPATRLKFATGSSSVTAKGHLADYRDKLKYVFSAKAGDRLTVNIDAMKWAGDEGPIMVGIVTMPDGSSDGAPGGIVFDDELTQSGEYEVLVYQNGAKSQAREVDVSTTVTLVGQKAGGLQP